MPPPRAPRALQALRRRHGPHLELRRSLQVLHGQPMTLLPTSRLPARTASTCTAHLLPPQTCCRNHRGPLLSAHHALPQQRSISPRKDQERAEEHDHGTSSGPDTSPSVGASELIGGGQGLMCAPSTPRRPRASASRLDLSPPRSATQPGEGGRCSTNAPSVLTRA